jgi:shikimate kinase
VDAHADWPLIALVGLPAVGKSTIGRRLALSMERVFYDTDDLVEDIAGRSIVDIFEKEGEPRFRELEGIALERIHRRKQAAVVATGGGIVSAERSRDFLARRAFSIYLRSSQSRIVARLSRSNKRPLFSSGNVSDTLARLHAQRDPLYRAVARLTVDVGSSSMATVLATIAERLAYVASSDRALGSGGADGN